MSGLIDRTPSPSGRWSHPECRLDNKSPAELIALIERLRLEAVMHAQEARTANATIAEIYQVCTVSTGEPGNWNGAEPVRRMAEQRAELLAACVEFVRKVDAGQARSKAIYAQMKAAIAKCEGGAP